MSDKEQEALRRLEEVCRMMLEPHCTNGDPRCPDCQKAADEAIGKALSELSATRR